MGSKSGQRRRPGLSLKPQNVNTSTWYYEERRGICVVRQIRDKDDVLRQSDTFYLPWKKIEASVDRYRDSKAGVVRFGKAK